MRLPYTSRFNCRAASKIRWQLSSSSAASKHGRFGQRQGLLGHALGDDVGKLFPPGPSLEQAVELGLVDEVVGTFAEFEGSVVVDMRVSLYVRLTMNCCEPDQSRSLSAW